MSAAALLAKAESMGVHVLSEGDKLRLRWQGEGLSHDFRAALSEHKAELLTELRRREQRRLEDLRRFIFEARQFLGAVAVRVPLLWEAYRDAELEEGRAPLPVEVFASELGTLAPELLDATPAGAGRPGALQECRVVVEYAPLEELQAADRARLRESRKGRLRSRKRPMPARARKEGSA